MNWAKSISLTEIAFLLVFLLIYGFYFWRTKEIGKAIGKASRVRLLKFVWRAVYFTLFVMALLGPSFGKTETEVRFSSQNILLAIDLSASMNTSDVAPNRLEKVKLELYNLLNNVKNNRVGLILFSDRAYWQIPFTYDTQLVREYISALDTEIMPSSGSNLNAPLRLINEKIKPSTKACLTLIVSDGESFEAPDMALINTLKTKQVEFMFLGVGTENGGSVQYKGQELKQEDGSPIRSHLKVDELQAFSQALDAPLFFLKNDFSELSKVNTEIQKSQNIVLPGRKRLVINNKYSIFLLIGFMLAALDFMVPIKVFRL
ncbi:VWA domain-containing protein [Marinilongibacter aquaticus]|uniref:vWA domain-containing protein n=1 Tax=Marinilongibacter aquaticus TaxID=2975157 RepID=UPI0021BD328A|nr:VWA domain-containing protein [Marinilongibacter aquaticus]UBM59217.1 VWA domain-containing protein [Marinilongibacter aquaticus]